MFRELAPSFLYGGYIQVRVDYEVYIRTVEFYFHSEKADGVSLEFLLRMFFKAIDPTSLNKQGPDEGTRYRTGVYFFDF